MKTSNTLFRVALILSVLASVVVVAHADDDSKLPVTLTFDGYVQARWTDTLQSKLANQSTFAAQRIIGCAYVNIGSHLGAFLDVSGASTDPTTKLFETKVIEAYGEYFVHDIKLRAGLSREPFGYEAQLSSQALITLERSQAINSLLPTSSYGYDKGIFGYLEDEKSPIKFSFGVVNGQNFDQPTDSNNAKNIVGRLAYKLANKHGEIGASVYDGTLPALTTTLPIIPVAGGVSGTAQRYDVDAGYYSGPLTVLTEWISGDTGSAHVLSHGGSLTVAYKKPTSHFQPYIRYDLFNPNENDTTNLSYRRTSIGLARYLGSKWTKVSIEYDIIHDGSNPTERGLLATQLQVFF
jgi:hypothetical protein